MMKVYRIKVTLAVVAVALAAGAIFFTGLSPAPASAQGAVATLYKSKCASCHGVDGKGMTAKGKETKARDFYSAEVKKMTDDQLLQVTLKGKNKMPGYEKQLGADKCKELIAYIRATFK